MKLSLLALATWSSAVSALKVPLRQTKRASFGVPAPTTNAGSSGGQLIGVTDNQDLIYLVNITMGGQLYTLQLDTGSSDLWITVSGSIPGKQSNLNANLTYGVGFAAGPICTVDTQFAGFDIAAQAYLAATQVNNPAMAYGAIGIMGMGFTKLSNIDMAVNQTGGDWGRSLLYNIFALSKATPNLVTMMLERMNDPTNQTQGVFTIGEYDTQFAGVADTAAISTFPKQSPSRWSVLVDGIIVNGNSVQLSSAVPNAPSSSAVALLDSGTSLVYAPTDIVSAMYGNVDGAQFSNSLNQWIVPCDAEIDVSVVINRRQFNIHPLDTVQPTTNGSQTCVGSWLPKSIAFGKTEFDYIFGDAVMRSVYTVYGFGDFLPNNQLSDPYVKLWSLVDGPTASREFSQIRGGSSSNHFLSNDNVNAPANSSSPSTSSSGTDISDLQTKVHNILKWAPLAIGVAALNAVVMLVVLIVTIVACVRRRRNERSIAPSGSYVPLPLGTSSHNYRPVSLQETKYNSSARYSD